MSIRLSPHFTLYEYEFSANAVRFGIANHMTTKAQLLNAKALCRNVLEPIRTGLNRPVFITSGFRNPATNRLAGGQPNSQHMRAQAADIHVSGMTTDELFMWIIKSGIVFDQILDEYGAWVHVSFKANGKNRRSIMRVTHDKTGAVVYTKLSEAQVLAPPF